MKSTLENLPRSDWQAVVNPACTVCHGSGWRGEGNVCMCVWRGVWCSVYAKFRYCAHSSHHKPVSIDGAPGPEGRRKGYGIRDAEFMADFVLIARRELDPAEYKVFRLHFLLGAECPLCCQKLGLSRGNFFHATYRIQQKLGRVFATLTPFRLYPVDEYFGGNTRRVDRRPLPAPIERYVNGQPLRPPLAAPAPRGPVPVPCAPKPAPAAVPLALAAGDVPAYVRGLFGKKGRTLRTIARDLTGRNVPAPNGTAQWSERDVRGILLTAPSGPRLRKAA
jgi:hypothetical protein